jgi:5-methylcytosine-specific restriction endonuclease McrA
MAQDYARAFYNSKEWRECQAAVMQSKNHTCERCGHLALIVHHKIHIAPANIDDPNITLNWDNLQALCLDCHNAEHGNGGACIEGVSFDDNGDLIYIPPVLKVSSKST